MVIQTIGGGVDEVHLCGDEDSFVEMDQQVIHVVSSKFGEKYFKVILEESDGKDYFESIHHDEAE